MILKLHTPSYPLSEFIELFTYYEGYNPPHTIERLLPEGVVDIIIDLTENPKYIYDNISLKEIQSCQQAWVSGMRTEFISIQAGGSHTAMFVVRFKPGRAWPFLQIPVSEVDDCVVDADLIFGNETAFLREALMAATSHEELFTMAEQYFMKRGCGNFEIQPVINYAVKEILDNSYETSIKKIVDKTGYSHKHFVSLFSKYVGLNPKQFLLVTKFQKAIQAIENSKNIHWAGLALDCGYYDQAHFINDFKKFSGFNPVAYVEARGEFVNYVPIN